MRCPLPPAIELIGEKWAFLILRGALNGLQHFEQFQAGLGIARNILSNRLARMVDGGISTRTPDPLDGRKVVYALTDKGEALLPVVLALRQWGEDWGHGTQEMVLADQRDGKPVRADPRARRGRPRARAARPDVDRPRHRRDAQARATPSSKKGGPAGPPSRSPTHARPPPEVRKSTRNRRPTGSGAAGRRR